MSPDPSSEKEPRALRPLPSVNMALLPDQLKARRTKRIVLGTLVGTVVLSALLFWIAKSLIPTTWSWMEDALGRQDAKLAADLMMEDHLAVVKEDGGVQPEISEAESLALVRSQPNARYETLFGTVPSFRGALLNAGLDAEECDEIEQALQHIVDFRRCRPEYKLIVERGQNAELKHFEYHPSATEFVAVTRGQDGIFRAEQIRVQVERTPIARAASVQTSIGDALAQIGMPAGLATFFTEAFEGRINFPLQARQGDVFRVIVDEERVDGEFLRYGRVHALEYDGQKTGTAQAFYYQTGGEPGQYYDETGRAMQGGWLRTPLRYERLSSRFNLRRFHPILRRTVPHLGIDYAAPTGTPVWAAATGRVTFAGRKGPNGNLVVIRHSGGWETAYAHLHHIKSGIRPGKLVQQRELIGFVGSTGRSTGPHLHFGLKRYNRFIDPMTELNGPGQRLPAREMSSFKKTVAGWQAQLSAIPDAPPLVPGADEPLVEQVDEVMD
ncbi:MAG: peptidoglycan DD-metalloendopeptidase family protein [Polyangiales bacterium]